MSKKKHRKKEKQLITPECVLDPSAGAISNHCQSLNLDHPFGFQNINPLTLLLIANITGNQIAAVLPTNASDTLGNWIQLIAATISTYSTQQLYSEGGPGRYYSCIYKNISNPYLQSK